MEENRRRKPFKCDTENSPKQRTAEEIDEILRKSEIFLTDEEADKMLKDIE